MVPDRSTRDTVVRTFASKISQLQLLNYIETEGRGSTQYTKIILVRNTYVQKGRYASQSYLTLLFYALLASPMAFWRAPPIIPYDKHGIKLLFFQLALFTAQNGIEVPMLMQDNDIDCPRLRR